MWSRSRAQTSCSRLESSYSLALRDSEDGDLQVMLEGIAKSAASHILDTGDLLERYETPSRMVHPV